ncbi:MAG TPA: glycosyltransferase family 39 protein [Candidatus Brocadiia bacterium]|nr:glycosyltransferase family 39 protein [Candidatus Brocadiia bacterium]
MTTGNAKTTALKVVFIALAGICIALPMAAWPLNRDEGIFAVCADAILRGEKLYDNAFDFKGPGVHYLYALAFATFGRSMQSPRILDLAGTILAAWLLYRCGLRIGNRRGAFAGAAFYFVWYVSSGWLMTGQAEGFAAPLTAAGLLCSLRLLESHTAGRAALAGLLTVLAFWFKPPFALLGLVPAAGLIAQSAANQQERKKLAASLIWLIAGGILGLVIPAIILSARDELDGFWEAVIVFNLRDYRNIAYPRSLRHLLRLSSPFDWTAFFSQTILALVAAHAGWGGRERPGLICAIAGLVVALFCCMMQGKFFAYQWVMTMPFVCVLAGQGVSTVLSGHSSRPGFAGRPAAALGLAVFIFGGWEAAARLASELEWRFRDSSNVSRFMISDGSSIPTVSRVAEYVRAHTRTDDAILVWGFDPLIYFLSERRPCSRFCYIHPFLPPGNEEIIHKYQAQFMEQLRRNPPAVILVADADQTIVQPFTSLEAMPQFQEFRDFVASRFSFTMRIDNYYVYSRASGPWSGQ